MPPIPVKVSTVSRLVLAVLVSTDMRTLPLLSPSVLFSVSQLACPVMVQWVLLVTVTSLLSAALPNSILVILSSRASALGDWVTVMLRSMVPFVFFTVMTAVRVAVDDGFCVTLMVAFCEPRPFVGLMLRIQASLHVTVHSQFWLALIYSVAVVLPPGMSTFCTFRYSLPPDGVGLPPSSPPPQAISSSAPIKNAIFFFILYNTSTFYVPCSLFNVPCSMFKS